MPNETLNQAMLLERKAQLEKKLIIKEEAHDLDQLAMIEKTLGDNHKAMLMLEKAIALSPENPILQNHIGLLFYAQENYSLAKAHFAKALNLKKDYFDAMYNLALTFLKQDERKEAIASLMAILAANEHHLHALFLMGKIALLQKDVESAHDYFQKVLDHFEDPKGALLEMIQCWLDNEAFAFALSYCEHYLNLDDQNIDILYNLALLYAKNQQKEKAYALYKKILVINPHHFSTLNNLAVLSLENNDRAKAKTYFERALIEKPDDQAILYSLNALKGESSFQKAPKAYIQNLFDQYADHFDTHLRQGLNYQTPEYLFETCKTCHIHPDDEKWIIGDLGCGTGLCAPLFKPWAQKLVGVDISPKMIEAAEKKSIYDELYVEDNLVFLEKQGHSFNLLIAADVLVYQGDLQPLFEKAMITLKPSGFFAFTTEISTKEDFMMDASGRFSHHQDYLKQLAQKTGFKLITLREAPTRQQRGQQLFGYYVVLRA